MEKFISREAFDRGVFGQGSNFGERFVPNHEVLSAKVEALKTLGLKVVLTSGSFDVIHIGHARYIEKAREHGDIVIIGVDSDEKIKKRKGENRPLVPQEERLEMLSHIRNVDIITLKEITHEKWGVIKAVRPNVLIATEETYTDEQIEALHDYCDEVVVLERQAETSTSEKLRKMQMSTAGDLGMQIMEVIENYRG